MSTIAKHHVKGMPPMEDPIVGLAIEERLREEDERRRAEHVENRSDDPARFIASDAYSCPRRIAFGRLGVPKDIAYTQQQLMTFRAGDWYHEVASEAIIRKLNARCNVDFDWRPEFSLYGKADGVYASASDPTKRRAVEIKSQAGYGFDLATGARRGEGPGPKIDHLIQAGLAALCPGIDAGAVHIVYINKDRGAVAEWVIGVDEPLVHLAPTGDATLAALHRAPDEVADLIARDGLPIPTVRSLVTAELTRLAIIGETLDAGMLPSRDVPGYGVVDDPPEAGSRGKPWNCVYCSWQPSCCTQPTEAFAFTQDDDKRIETAA